jgi:sulfur carrier protein
VKILLRNPKREVELRGPLTVNRLLDQLELNRESHLVVCNGTLVPGDARLDDGDSVEVRPVVSGGAR